MFNTFNTLKQLWKETKRSRISPGDIKKLKRGLCECVNKLGANFQRVFLIQLKS